VEYRYAILRDCGVHARELLAGAEGLVEHRAAGDVAHLGAHEGATLARLHVLEVDDRERLPVDLDGHAGLELVGADYVCHVVLLRGRLYGSGR